MGEDRDPVEAVDIVPPHVVIDPLPLHFFAERYADSYIAELSAFVRCIVEKTAPPVTASDGRAAVVAALAALDSLKASGLGP